MKILIISGFLGAGKTTFIQNMARVTGRDFVIYENEYAGAGIDTERLQENDNLSVWEATENCVCCSGRADFASSVLTISCSLDPEYLIVEPTGLAKLGVLLGNLKQILYGDMVLLRPLVIVDAPAFPRQLSLSPDIYLDQIRSAARIYLSKTERLLPEELAALRDKLHEINPDAPVFSESWRSLQKEDFQTILNDPLAGDIPVPAPGTGETAPPMEQLTLSGAALSSPVHLIVFLNALSYGSCGDILRAKGCLPCGDVWLQFDFVDNLWQITGAKKQILVPDTSSAGGKQGRPSGVRPQSECVFIGPNLARNKIRMHLQEELFLGGVRRPSQTPGTNPVRKLLRKTN